MQRQKLFVCVCLVSFFSSANADSLAVRTEKIRKDLEVTVPTDWIPDVARVKNKTGYEQHSLRMPAERYFAGQACYLFMLYNDACRTAASCSDYNANDENIGQLFEDCCGSDACMAADWNQALERHKYQCTQPTIYGVDTDKIARSRMKKTLTNPNNGPETFLGKQPGIEDQTVFKIVRSKKPRLLGILNVVMTCREDAYAAEKPKLDKFLESIKFRGRLLVEPGHDWSPQPPKE